MTAARAFLEILVVDDDPEVIGQLKELLPPNIAGNAITWELIGDFDDALTLLQRRRFDLLVSDIYRGREKAQKNIAQGDIKARQLVDEIRDSRFCPIVLFTDGQVPPELVGRPFVWSTDKSVPDFVDRLSNNIAEAIATGLPGIARDLHNELDRYTGSYVWKFLADHWESLKAKHGLDERMLERIIRRRAATYLGQIDAAQGDLAVREIADPVDYYIYPPISEYMRLGEVIRRKGTSEFRVVLTPHCFLAVQAGRREPRATYVLTAVTVPAGELRATWKWQSKKEAVIADELRRRTSFAASNAGSPEGRYCFIPAFLDIPDLYCDLMQIESIGLPTLVADFDRVAVLDGPFAEALQASLARLYGAVGVPVLNPEFVKHLAPDKAS